MNPEDADMEGLDFVLDIYIYMEGLRQAILLSFYGTAQSQHVRQPKILVVENYQILWTTTPLETLHIAVE